MGGAETTGALFGRSLSDVFRSLTGVATRASGAGRSGGSREKGRNVGGRGKGERNQGQEIGRGTGEDVVVL